MTIMIFEGVTYRIIGTCSVEVDVPVSPRYEGDRDFVIEDVPGIRAERMDTGEIREIAIERLAMEGEIA